MKVALIAFFALSFLIFIPNIKKAFSISESENFSEAVNNLQHLACNQIDYCETHKHSYPNCKATSICNNSSSLVASTEDLTNAVGPFFMHTSIEGGGDVRYRCRKQNNIFYCFAFRCAQENPAGCEQKWRIKYKIKVRQEILPIVPLWTGYAKCFDVGEDDGICPSINSDTTFPCSYASPLVRCSW
jgi:hypothetical protein